MQKTGIIFEFKEFPEKNMQKSGFMQKTRFYAGNGVFLNKKRSKDRKLIEICKNRVNM